MDNILDTQWSDVVTPQSTALAVRSSDLQPVERLNLVPVVYDNLPAQYQTQENYKDLELRARSNPQSFDRAIELTGQSIPQLVQNNTYHLTTSHTENRPTIINFTPHISVTATASNSEAADRSGWLFWGTLFVFLAIIGFAVGDG